MSTALTIAVNTDTQDQPYGASGVEWTDISLPNDLFIMTKGSNVIKDGEPFPSATDLTYAGILLDGSEQVVSLYLLADLSDDELKEIHLMGNQNKRYVMAFSFDGATASEPVLEAWDNSDMNSIDNTMLGSGVATSSWLRGITTTASLPGADWVGSRIAGASDGNYLWLNDESGPLTIAKVLYCNLKLIVPASQSAGIAETPILVCKYTTN